MAEECWHTSRIRLYEPRKNGYQGLDDLEQTGQLDLDSRCAVTLDSFGLDNAVQDRGEIRTDVQDVRVEDRVERSDVPLDCSAEDVSGGEELTQ